MAKHYVTQYKNHLGNFGETTPCSNPLILAERAKWNHRLKDKWFIQYIIIILYMN